MYNKEFDPNSITPDNGNYFGISLNPEESALVLLSAPWDATSSLLQGSSYAPDAIIEMSRFVDFYEPIAPDSWRKGIATIPVDYSIQDLSHRLQSDTERLTKLHDEFGLSVINNLMYDRRLKRVNEGSVEVNDALFNQVKQWTERDKIVGVIGGDQSVSYSAIKAMGYKYEKLGVIHVASKCYMREAYQGFDFSHASTMYNVMRDVPQVEQLSIVGAQEFSPIEWERATSNSRVRLFTAQEMWTQQFEGKTWAAQVADIVETMPQNVYVALNISGLMSAYSPNKGRVSNGGLSLYQLIYLMDRVITSGRRIVGFDITEVVPRAETKRDILIVARLLFKMCSVALKGVEAKGIL
jgi:agmatinase